MADSKIQEEARLRYPKVIGKIIATGDLNDYRRWAFIAGAEWQKKQMKKDAVEATVLLNAIYGISHYVKTNEEQLTESLKRFKDGDKVKVIIVKEGEV